MNERELQLIQDDYPVRFPIAFECFESLTTVPDHPEAWLRELCKRLEAGSPLDAAVDRIPLSWPAPDDVTCPPHRGTPANRSARWSWQFRVARGCSSAGIVVAVASTFLPWIRDTFEHRRALTGWDIVATDVWRPSRPGVGIHWVLDQSWSDAPEQLAFTGLAVAMVCGIALGILGDFAASEDAGQEAFLTAWRKIHDLREPERLRAWLGQIARTAALGQFDGSRDVGRFGLANVQGPRPAGYDALRRSGT